MPVQTRLLKLVISVFVCTAALCVSSSCSGCGKRVDAVGVPVGS